MSEIFTLGKMGAFFPHVKSSTLIVCVCVCCRREVLNLSDNLDKLGPVSWKLALCLVAIWVICYFCVWKGVKSTGKVSGNPTIVTCVRLDRSKDRIYSTMFYTNAIGLPISGLNPVLNSASNCLAFIENLLGI